MQLIAIVHEDPAVAAEWAVSLSAAGYRVVTSASFEDGKSLLDADIPPALLIASVRLLAPTTACIWSFAAGSITPAWRRS